MTWQPLRRTTPVSHGGTLHAMPENWQQWANDTYVVFRRVIEGKEDIEPMIHLSIRRQDRAPARDWRDFQRIKNQLAGPEYEGVELYPAESRKVDTANQYHLWCFPFTLGFGLGDERMVTDSDSTLSVQDGAVQRDHEEADGRLNTTEELAEWTERAAKAQVAQSGL